jgi:hypothetical protein
MGNFVNDFSVSKAFNLDNGSKLNAKAGLFYSRQNVVQKWSISTRVVEAAYNGAVIDVYNANNAALTNQGLTGYNNSWGADSAKNIWKQETGIWMRVFEMKASEAMVMPMWALQVLSSMV